MKKTDKETIKNVLADFREEIPNFDVNPRDFTFEEFGNYVFVGIRRAGKSFLLYQRMQQLLEQGVSADELLYINFEDERLMGMTVQDLNLLLEIHLELYGKKPILFLDEIQNINGWEKFARRLADTKHRVYITGSNAKMLSKDIQTTLGGRYIAVEVYPYSFREFLTANGIDFSQKTLTSTAGKAEILRKFNDYFYFGGFPEGATLAAKRDYLTSVYQKIYLGDIAVRYSVDNTFALRIMIKKLAESVKQPISFNRIGNIVSSTGAKIGTSTVINYIDYAKDAWLITPIQNITDKLVEKETKPKYYFIDNGLLNLFLIDGNTALLENLVAITLLRKLGREDAVFFYHKNVEVDFYIPESETAIQVCYDLDSSPDTFDREVNALVKLTKVLTCQKLLIITRDTEKTLQINDKSIDVIPIWKWLLEN
ncbi:ATP-binding protein [Sphingobacterium sp. DN00404]|uniref:ATP-binding protein n=1 Tax=Sphingobacterium micropteri TaxID=2763501 RepID=A0ABR7YRF3_9SPHI|nr:ATP-binding protein [Sphingobacterium micropteri]MBD1433928.1 ATP-binding protein [Sphingobacterium micropteri]